jgi:hypothetical protein
MNINDSYTENEDLTFKQIVLFLKEWISFLKSKVILILIIGVIGALLGLISAISSKTKYNALLTFALEDDKSSSPSGGGGISSALGLASSFGIDLGGAGGGGIFASANLIELMKSRFIIEKTLLSAITIDDKTISLADYYIQINNLRDSWINNELKNITFPPNTNRSNFSLQQDSVLEIISKKIKSIDNLSIFQKDKKVAIISILVTSPNEIFAKKFCEKLASEVSQFYIETKSKKAKLNVDILQKQSDSVRASLNNSMVEAAGESDKVFNLNLALNLKGVPSRKKIVDVQANSKILENITVQLELAKITLRKETPLIQIIDKPIFPLEKIKTSKLISILIGFVASSLVTIFYLLMNRMYKKAML